MIFNGGAGFYFSNWTIPGKEYHVKDKKNLFQSIFLRLCQSHISSADAHGGGGKEGLI